MTCLVMLSCSLSPPPQAATSRARLLRAAQRAAACGRVAPLGGLGGTAVGPAPGPGGRETRPEVQGALIGGKFLNQPDFPECPLWAMSYLALTNVRFRE